MSKTKKTVYNILTVVFVLIFAVSAFVLGRYILDSHKQQSKFDELAGMVEDPPSGKPAGHSQSGQSASLAEMYPDCVIIPDFKTGKEIPVLPEYLELYRQNPDVIGWMKLEGTKLNYPVMQTPDRKDYYLRRDFDGSSSSHGCLFARGVCDVYRPSDNITIYGHNMRDGSMFAVLHRYENQDFRNEHPVITFNTLRQRNKYEVFAVFKTSATKNQGFPYHLFVDTDSSEEFDKYVSTCKQMSLYDTGITPVFGDKLISLSTCDYSLSNGRLVVVARRISDASQN